MRQRRLLSLARQRSAVLPKESTRSPNSSAAPEERLKPRIDADDARWASQTLAKGQTQFVLGCRARSAAAKAATCGMPTATNTSISPMALGAVTLGHGDPEVDAAVAAQLERWHRSSRCPHPLEVEVAERIVRAWCRAPRWCASARTAPTPPPAPSASPAPTPGAIGRLCGYHGWQDWYIGATTRNQGVPEGTSRRSRTRFQYNDLAALEALFREHPGEMPPSSWSRWTSRAGPGYSCRRPRAARTATAHCSYSTR